MRSVILIGLVVFFAVVAGGYGIGWYVQAGHMKSGLEQAIANINTRQNVLSYQAIETSGFPGSITLSLVNPKFSGRADLLLKSLPASPGQPSPLASLPAWQEDDTLDGRITFTVSPLSSLYHIGISGGLHHASTIGGKTQTADITRSGEAGCSLTLSRSGWLESLWDYQSLLTREHILSDFRTLDCDSPGYLATGPKHEPLLESAPSRLYITSHPAQGIEALRTYLKANGTEITPAGDAWLTNLSTALGRNMPSGMALYGKQTVEINLAYTGPASAGEAGKAPVDLRLAPFKLDSSAYHTDISLYLTDNGPATPRNARLQFHAVSNFGANYAAIQQNMLKRVVADMYADKTKVPPNYRATLDKYTPDQMLAILSPAVPQLYVLSPLTEALDVAYAGNPDFKTGDVTLAGLELSAAPYGITGKGTAHLNAGLPPSGDFTLQCSHCLQLVDDVTAYTGRLHTTFSYFDPAAAAATQIDPRLVAGIKGFLGALATKDATGNNFTFDIASSGGLNATVNGHSLPEVSRLYDQYVGTVLRQERAEKAAVTPPTSSSPELRSNSRGIQSSGSP